MKKNIAILSTLALTCGLFAGCAPTNQEGSSQATGLAAPYYGDQLLIASLSQLRDKGLAKEGESLIGDADALLDNDIVISNGKMAATICVDTPDPWGYPVGSLVDLATVQGDAGDNLADAYKNGSLTVSNDRLWDMRLLMNSWDTWTPSTCGDITFEVVEDYQFDEHSEKGAALKVTCEYKEKSPTDTQDFETPLILSTYYALGAEDDYMKIKTVFENNGAQTYHDRAVGYSLSSKSTSVFSPGVEFYSEDPAAQINDFTTIYNPEYTVGLLTPGIDDVWVDTGYSDTYKTMSFEAGTTSEIVGYLRVDNTTDISAVTNQLMDIKNVPASARVEIRGTVVDDTGAPVPHANVAIERQFGENWKPLTWCTADENGTYSITVPKIDNLSEYRLYGMAENYAITPKENRPLVSGTLSADETPVCEIVPLVLSKAVKLDVNVTDQNGTPIPAKIKINGVNRCVVDYIANDLFFTDLDKTGHAEVLVYPGDYELSVSSGVNFFSENTIVKGNTNEDTTLNITVDRIEDLRDQGWYNVDMHHHVNKGDACTKPINWVKSTLAEGMTILFSSDHDDATANHEISEIVSENECDAVHIPGVEISASWSHFNAVPTDEEGRNYMLDPSTKYKFNQYAPFPEMVDSVHERNMLFIANHPWIGYGLFNEQSIDSIPGGYYDQFDLIELNGGITDEKNEQAMDSARVLWTESLSGGKVYFLTGGSDTHDVLDSTANRCSGEIRNFVKMDTNVESIENELPVQLMNGHGYVSSGPLMFPSDDAMFGDTFSIGEQGSMDYTLPVQAVNGLDKIEVYSQDGLVDTYTFEGAPETGTYTITLQPTEKSWYQFVVTDTLGLHAYSNPIFLEP